MSGLTTAIVGAGRMGQALGLGLAAAGWDVTLIARTARPVAAGLRLHVGPRDADVVRAATLVLVATPDDAISAAAAHLAGGGGVGSSHAVLHLSGLLDRSALLALAETGAALGSFHPLQSVADPAVPERLRGAYAGIEGDSRAIAMAERVAKALGMTAIPLDPTGKALYHAGAVLAANYTTALVAAAELLGVRAGVPPDVAARMYLPLAAGALTNVTELGAVQALTGPIRRADLGTIRAHLAALPPDVIPLYRALGLAALDLAREAGLPAAKARAVRNLLLRNDEGGGRGG